MGTWGKFKKKVFGKSGSSWTKAVATGGLSALKGSERKTLRKSFRSTREDLGLTSRNKKVRQLRGSLGLSRKGHTVSSLGSSSSTSATTEGYKYSGNSISQLMGGV